ncbi:MAG: NAD-dependent epimerase/dehydratase family protein [Candidatus Wallbacteria bacterium]|nr:NAD-dependent epimerase/dehydratase family protein [Candidatus Wallbacteria bacterium]
MKKILVTGAAGFMGNHLITELLRLGHVVVATDCDQARAAKSDWWGWVRYIQYQIVGEDERDLFRYFGNPDLVIHLAWQGLPNYKELFHFERNLPQSYFFLKNLVEHGLENVTALGTCLEYGMQEGCLSEKMDVRPVLPYALAKDTLRRFLEEFAVKKPFALKWLRPFYLHGKGQSEKSLFSQLDLALSKGEKSFPMSGGEQVRDYLPVELAVCYIARVALQELESGIFNICSGKPVTVRQMVLDYLSRTGKSIELDLGVYPYPDYEPLKFWGDNSKLKNY